MTIWRRQATGRARSRDLYPRSVGAASPTIAADAFFDAPAPAPTLYYAVKLSSGWTEPTSAAIVAGTGFAAAGSEASPIVTTAPFDFTATIAGLTAGTAYRVSVVWYDGSTYSNVTSSGDVTTSSAGTPVGLAVEVDAALGLARLQISAAGLATETDTALALAPRQIGATGIATETDASLALAGVQLRATGLASEADTALALAVGAVVGAVGLATETDAALTLAGTQIRAVGLATEADSALTLTGRHIRATGIATEADTALALTPGAAPGTVGIAQETDTALALAGVQRRAVGLATHVNTSLALGAISIRAAGLALEIDTGFALTARQIGYTGTAEETDTALTLAGGLEAPEVYAIAVPRMAIKTNGETFRLVLQDGVPVAAIRRNGAHLRLSVSSNGRALTDAGDVLQLI